MKVDDPKQAHRMSIKCKRRHLSCIASFSAGMLSLVFVWGILVYDGKLEKEAQQPIRKFGTAEEPMRDVHTLAFVVETIMMWFAAAFFTIALAIFSGEDFETGKTIPEDGQPEAS